jgi:uracil-DNA glycosylase family 4
LNESRAAGLEVWLRYADDLGLGPYYTNRRSTILDQPSDSVHVTPPTAAANHIAQESPGAAISSNFVSESNNWSTAALPKMPKKTVSLATPAVQVTAQTPAPESRPLIQVATSAASLFEERVANDSLPLIQEAIGHNCTRCKLHKGRTKLVFGVGNPKADLVFIGEGPGRDEDMQGEPFVGRAGKLLTQMIEAMGLKREDVYIANVVKCRPPENRLPEKDEITTCSPFLMRQIDVIQPKVVCTLGSCAAQTLLQTTQGITRFRGEWFDFRGAKLMPTYHPAYLLRNPAAKSEVWKDLQKVMAHLGLQAKRKQAQAGVAS